MPAPQELQLRDLFSPFVRADDLIRHLLRFKAVGLLNNTTISTSLQRFETAREATTRLIQAQNAQFGHHRASEMTISAARDFLADANFLVWPETTEEQTFIGGMDTPVGDDKLSEEVAKMLPRDELAAYWLFVSAFAHLSGLGLVTYSHDELSSRKVVGTGFFEDAQSDWNLNHGHEGRARMLVRLIVITQALFEKPREMLEEKTSEVIRAGHFYASVAYLSHNLIQD